MFQLARRKYLERVLAMSEPATDHCILVSCTACFSCIDALTYGVLMVRQPFLSRSISLMQKLVALKFDPDRFLDHRLKKYLTPNPYIFVPFNAGPRICLGQQFAYNEMEFFLVKLLQNFSEINVNWATQPESSKTAAGWIPTKEPMNIGYDLGLTMSVKVSHIECDFYAITKHLLIQGGLWVNMKEAEPSL